MSWLIVAALTVVDWYFPAREADRPRARHVAVALAALLLSMVADLVIALAVVLHLPHGDFLPSGILGLCYAVTLADGLWYVFHRLSPRMGLLPWSSGVPGFGSGRSLRAVMAAGCFHGAACRCRSDPVRLVGLRTYQRVFASWPVRGLAAWSSVSCLAPRARLTGELRHLARGVGSAGRNASRAECQCGSASIPSLRCNGFRA